MRRRNSSCVSATSSSRLFRSAVALMLGGRLDHPLAQVGDDVGLLEHHVDGAGAERLDGGLVGLAGGHDDDRGQRGLVARKLKQLDPPARRRGIGVDQGDGEELVEELVARPHGVVGPRHDQPDPGQ